MARPVWSGHIVFGLVSIPVRFFPATTSHDIHFNLLHRKTRSRIKLQYFCPECEKVVSKDELVRGYEYEKGKYVLLEDEELQKIRPQSSKTLEIAQFIDLSEVDPVYFERSYYVAPDKGGEKAFELLTEAMRETNKAAVGKLLMRDHEYLALIRAGQQGLVAQLMYYEDEIRKNENKVPVHPEPAKKQLDLAKNLIENLTDKFVPRNFSNEYIKSLDHLIESKITGRKLKIVPERKLRAVGDLMTALQKSVEQTTKRAATGKTKTRRKTA
jgi:DNA end-binding protein Ku